MDELNVPGKFLYEEGESYFIRDKEGKIKKIPKNKFSHNQFVSTSRKHFSPKSFTRVINPTYIESRGWVYGESYANRQGGGGGCGFSFEEDLFEVISNPADLLFAQRLILQFSINKLNGELKSKTDALSKIEFALQIAVPNFEKIIDSCQECGVLYTRENQGNVNKAICKVCVTKAPTSNNPE